MNFVLNPNFFLTGTYLSLKVKARMEDKVRIKNLKSLFAIFEKFGRVFCCWKDGRLAKITVRMFGAFEFVGIMGASVSDRWDYPIRIWSGFVKSNS